MNIMDNLTLGERIRYFRKRAGLSQMELESELDLALGSISRIESNTINPTKETILKISTNLNLTALETSKLFGFSIMDSLNSVWEIYSKLAEAKSLEEVMQISVDDIVFKLGLYSGFITLVKGDTLWAVTLTTNNSSQISLSIIKEPFKKLKVPMSDKDNIMVDTIRNRKINITNSLIYFAYPAISMFLAKYLDRVHKITAGISLPLIIDDKCIGAIMFGKVNGDNFDEELDFLKKYAEVLSGIIKKYRKF